MNLQLFTKEQKNVSFVKEVLETMEKNFIKPEPTTVDIILRFVFQVLWN